MLSHVCGTTIVKFQANPNRWFPEVSVIPSDPLMFENLCSGKLIVFGGLSGGLIEDYLEERGA
jgi:hypothetical protein